MKLDPLGRVAVCLLLGLAACSSPVTPAITPSSTAAGPATLAAATLAAATNPVSPTASRAVTASRPVTATPSITAGAPVTASPSATARAPVTATPSATASASPSATLTRAPQSTPIGNVERKTDVVEHGSTADALSKLLGTAALFQGDVLKIHDGGEGLLNFGNQLSLELFNDSQLGVVSSSAPGTPLDIQIALDDGGFTGQLTTNGGRAVFTTPGGAQITVLGTDFLIAYDPATRVTTAGNFHGTVQVASAGVQVSIASGSAVVVPYDQPPGAQFPVTFTLAQFQQQARALRSPVLAANQNISLAGAAALAVGNDHTCALTASGGMKCWGNNDQGQLGNGLTTTSSIPVDVVGLPGRVIQVAIASVETCAVMENGAGDCWGSNVNGTVEVPQTSKPYPVSWPTGPLKAMAPGNGFTCVLTLKGGVECSGKVSFGQLGDGSLTSGVLAITGGRRDHTCALIIRGGVRCWGYGPNGELGNGHDGNSATPVDVVGLKEPVTAVVAGGNHSCVLTATGGVKCWGYNLNYELGNASAELHFNTPVDVEKLAGVVAIAAGANHTCALTIAGAVKCWGNNKSGQLGNGTTDIVLVPVEVKGLGSGVAAIAAGGTNTCALMTNGGIKCWGDNTYGQLGDGSTTSSETPVNVIGFGPLQQVR